MSRARFPLVVALAACVVAGGRRVGRGADAPGNINAVLTSTDTIVAYGTSITFGMYGQSWWLPLQDALKGHFGAQLHAPATQAAPGSIARAGAVPGAMFPRIINSGINGQNIAGFSGPLHFSTYVTRYAPTVVFIETAIFNDMASGAPLTAVLASAQGLIGELKALTPRPRIIWIGPMSDGEHWATVDGTPRYAGNIWPKAPAVPCAPYGCVDFDTLADSWDAALKAVVEAAGIVYIDPRPLGAAYEATHNPNNVPLGVLTTDGIHMRPEGAAIYSSAVLARVKLIP